ncbi:MAG: ketoacyl-ACP synthase III [Spirochaetaceae bacterium]|nr:ketoacyl-ACP synthase III [Spirochaetaceae bacterium]
MITIKGIGAYLPQKIMKNDDWRAYFDTSDEWIYSHTGIKERHVAADDEATSDMAVKAAHKALEQAGMTTSDIDMIICATCTPDYIGFPSTANLVQGKLGAGTIPSFDIRSACTGFIYGLSVAAGQVATGMAKNVLLVASETLTRMLDWHDRGSAILFGDGAGAAVISKAEQKDSLIDIVLYSKADDKALVRPMGGMKNPLPLIGLSAEEVKETLLKMDGHAVYAFAVRAISDVVNTILNRNNLKIEDVDYVIPHQANKRIIEAACVRNKWPIEKFFMNLDKVANTSAASIPIALNDMQEQGLLKKGMKLILPGFGAGLTWGGALIEW